MDNSTEKINQLVIKLKVLDNRIHKLESIADEVINEVETEYRKKIEELYLKEEAALQKLTKIQEDSTGENI